MALLTPFLLEEIQRGNAILFLGAGASIGARGAKGEEAPRGDKLRDLISDRFLGGQLKEKPLAQVAELAKNEANLIEVQGYIKSLFTPLIPAPFHRLIPTFRWYAIVTTNYDLVLERAYDKCVERQQNLAPILRDGDRFTEKLRDSTQVLYLKLHGCITETTNEQLPLILASEEYAKYRKGRERLFRHFQDWARERPIVFCGYDVGDPNIQQILFDLADMGISRPFYGLVNPDLNEIVARYWNSKRFAVTRATFDDFLNDLDREIPKSTRGLAALLSSDSVSIKPWVRTHSTPSTSLRTYLQEELVHLHKSMPCEGVSPDHFYKGLTVEFGAFKQELDVRRRVADDLIIDAFLEKNNEKVGQMYLLKGHAGSGKSVSLRRIAWDVVNEYDGLLFFLQEGALLRHLQLAELYALTGERLYIAIEDAVPYVKDISATMSWATKNGIPLTLIFGARTNEWNVYGNEIGENLDGVYELRDLTVREIAQLIEKLSSHSALGRLAAATAEERTAHFQLTAERQLLVALHDIYTDRPFEETVLDEFRKIVPVEARTLYLDVCTLHRLGVGVRAGLVSRISGITFATFEQQFFRPLEHVVRTYFDQSTRDNMYRSRHSLIAGIVFERALPDPVERVNQIIRIIRNMDVDYTSDNTAFRQLIRGRGLADLFADKNLAIQIFQAALESGAPISFVEHQRAVFELHHHGGDLRGALAAIERAESALDYEDRSILHTKAAILRSLAINTPQRLVRDRLREQAKEILRKNIRGSRVSHPYHTLGQIWLDELRDAVSGTQDSPTGTPRELRERILSDLIRHVEEAIYEGLQRFPEDEFLLSLEADFAKLLKDDMGAFDALKRAFESAPGRAFVAVRFAYSLRDQGKLDEAIGALKKCVNTNPSSKEAHLALGMLLVRKGEMEFKEEIAFHLKRSFTPGDSNLGAQFWFARHSFLYGDRENGLACFRQLSAAPASPQYRNRIRGGILDNEGKPKVFSGSVKVIKDGFCFVTCTELRTDVFVHVSQFDEEEWEKVEPGRQVAFCIGFSLRGVAAFDARLLTDSP